MDSAFAIQRRGTTWLTPQGALATAIRRNAGNSSARDFGRIVLEDLSAQTVLRCELEGAASYMASLRSFHRRAIADLVHSPAVGGKLALAIVSYKSDATNSSVWRQAKLHAAEIMGIYMEDLEAYARDADQVEWARGYTDLQKVEDATAAGTHALLLNSLKSFEAPLLDPTRSDPLPYVLLHMYCSDGGSDQQKYRRLMICESASCSDRDFFRRCELHDACQPVVRQNNS